MMQLITEHILSCVIFAPLVTAALLLLVPRRCEALLRTAAWIGSAATFVLSLHLWWHFKGTTDYEFAEIIPWVSSLNIFYRIGIDGVSLLLILLTTFLMPIVLLSSWREIQKSVKEYLILMLILETGMIGTFSALDLFVFYVFWEVMLIPMYFLVGIWGSKQRIMASFKFVLYTMIGSVLMLVAILYGYFKGGQTFSLIEWYQIPFTLQEQGWLFGAFALAFAIKVPMFPLHTWLPDAHTEAPTAGSVILAGVLLKMGTYGFFRFAIPLFPQAVALCAPYIMILSVIGIVYGALVAMVQPDIKRLVAYSSVSHLGFVMLGLFSLNTQAVSGAVLQMINHGLSTGALFLLVGQIYERRHTRQISDYGGIAKIVPLYTFFFLFASLASIGLPGLNGFVGEFLILLGAFQVKPTLVAVAVTGVILSAVYLLWMIERVFFGPVQHEENKTLKDLGWREVAVLVPLCIAMLAIGVYPKPWLGKINTATGVFLKLTQRNVIASESAPSPIPPPSRGGGGGEGDK